MKLYRTALTTLTLVLTASAVFAQQQQQQQQQPRRDYSAPAGAPTRRRMSPFRRPPVTRSPAR